MHFKIKKSTKMSKVFEAYAQRRGVAAGSIRFMLDGQRVQADKTADEAAIEDGDQLDALAQQTGGC